jgi:SAM-dependent methyltransferase
VEWRSNVEGEAVIEHCVAEPDIALGSPAFYRSGIAIYECPSCGSFMADTRYMPEQYGDGYYTIATTDVEEVEQRWGFRWRYVLDGIVSEIGSAATVLDVGAGNGSFLRVAREEYGLDAVGIEVSAESAVFARDVVGVDIQVIDLAEVDGCFDVVTAFSLIEHVEDPAEFVRQLADRVAPGGLLVIATPNPNCIQRRIRGKRRWAQINPPHHLNVLSPGAVSLLLHGAGLTEVRREAVSTSVKLVRRIDSDAEHLRRAIFHVLRVTGLGADQLVFARRPHSDVITSRKAAT